MTAVLSPCRKYRYRLERSWAPGNRVGFLMLNPSTADETADDPTIRRCIGFAKDWGYGGLIVGNLFALRSTDPQALYAAADPVGPDNDGHLLRIAWECETVICAWGKHGAFRKRGKAVASMLDLCNLAALKILSDGSPGHPLYLPKNAQRVAYFA
jgi:hypothetical protein